jgi:hypothetical protein
MIEVVAFREKRVGNGIYHAKKAEYLRDVRTAVKGRDHFFGVFIKQVHENIAKCTKNQPSIVKGRDDYNY